MTWEVPTWIGLWDKVNLRQLTLTEERLIGGQVTELVSCVLKEIYEPLREISKPLSYESPANVTPSELFYLGHAFYVITQLRNIAPRIFVVTNDSPENEPRQFDDSMLGWIPEAAFRKHKFTTVPHGFGDGGVFRRDPGFVNYIFQIDDGDFGVFVEALLGGHMFPTIYWFAFADQAVDIENVKEAAISSTDEDDFVLSLCKICPLVVYGLEDDVYTFLTADQKVAMQLKKSFKERD